MKSTFYAAFVGATLALFFASVATVALTIVHASGNEDKTLGAVPLCTVTHRLVAIGNGAAVQILAPGSRQWAIIQQPINATNTVALGIGTSSVIGRGFELSSSTNSASMPASFELGFGTAHPTSASTTAITSTGSSTIKVTECK